MINQLVLLNSCSPWRALFGIQQPQLQWQAQETALPGHPGHSDPGGSVWRETGMALGGRGWV